MNKSTRASNLWNMIKLKLCKCSYVPNDFVCKTAEFTLRHDQYHPEGLYLIEKFVFNNNKAIKIE